jgi:cyanophycinase
VRNAQRWFAQFGLDVQELPVLQPSDAESPEIAATAAEGRFFYLVGGDPGHTVAVLRGSAVWTAIAGAWRTGAALGGSSAGAMAFGEWSLIRERWPNRSTRRYADGLGLVTSVAVLPHFETFGGRWVDPARAAAPREDVILLGIDERTAALWQGGQWRVAGPGQVTVIAGDGRRTFEPGEPIEGLPTPG